MGMGNLIISSQTVSPEVITHRLNMDPTYCPVKQKRRNFVLDHS